MKMLKIVEGKNFNLYFFLELICPLYSCKNEKFPAVTGEGGGGWYMHISDGEVE